MTPVAEFHLGFTGSQRGLTEHQREMLAKFLELQQRGLDAMGVPMTCVLHHGDCVGADDEAHDVAAEEGWDVEIHPGTDRRGESPRRAHADERTPDHVREVHEPKPYAVRNMDIVLAGTMLLACPEGPERRRSGTWSTVRAALQVGKPVVMIPPEDDVEFLGGEHEH